MIMSFSAQYQSHLGFENYVNHAFLVQVFWAKNAAGATFFSFCFYAISVGQKPSKT